MINRGVRTIIKHPFQLLLVVLLTTFCFVAIPYAESSSTREVGVKLTPAVSDPNASDITIIWTALTGDQLQKSVDGNNWVIVDETSNGQAEVVNVPNWSILYFRILNDSGTVVKAFTAYPPNANAHDTYAQNTEMCGNCHVTHAGSGPGLLKAVNQKELCRICHGYANTGSRYNTDNGAVIMAGEKDPDTGLVTSITWAKSLAGPLESNDLGVWGEGKTVTSTHDYGTNRDPVGGMGPVSPPSDCQRCHGTGFSCKSCHLIHGGQGTYRQLDPVYGTVKAYAYNPTGGQPEKPLYVSGMTQFCGFCHDRFVKSEDSGHVKTGQIWRGHGFIGPFPEDKYRHAVGVDLSYTLPGASLVTVTPSMLPTEGNPQTVSCITCHFAHGTVADVFLQTNFPTCLFGEPMGTSGSMLLRDGTGRLCQDCHPKE